MLGAIIGDIVGSRFEWDNNRTKKFDFLTHSCFATDDSIMSLAIAKAIMSCDEDYGNLGEMAIKYMQEVGRPYPNCGFGGMFYNWMYSDNPKPYGSYGNGAAMRVSACGFAAHNLEEAIALSKAVTEVTHNHPEGIKGAEATTVAIYMARTGSNLLEIQDYINKHYYKIDFKKRMKNAKQKEQIIGDDILGVVKHGAKRKSPTCFLCIVPVVIFIRSLIF